MEMEVEVFSDYVVYRRYIAVIISQCIFIVIF